MTARNTNSWRTKRSSGVPAVRPLASAICPSHIATDLVVEPKFAMLANQLHGYQGTGRVNTSS